MASSQREPHCPQTLYSLQQQEGPSDQQQGDAVGHNPDHLVRGSGLEERRWDGRNDQLVALGFPGPEQVMVSAGVPFPETRLPTARGGAPSPAALGKRCW